MLVSMREVRTLNFPMRIVSIRYLSVRTKLHVGREDENREYGSCLHLYVGYSMLDFCVKKSRREPKHAFHVIFYR